MGEAISRLSPELRERHPEVPWHQIVAVRHRIVHAYFDLDWQILWHSAMDDIPIAALISTAHPDAAFWRNADVSRKTAPPKLTLTGRRGIKSRTRWRDARNSHHRAFLQAPPPFPP
jgi:hypothetical protein